MRSHRRHLTRLLLALLTLQAASCAAAWEKTETEHLVLHYKPNSYAARNLSRACREYESVYESMFGYVPEEHIENKYRVFLHENTRRMGWVNHFTDSVHYRYDAAVRLVSSHEFMHLVLEDANPNAPGRFQEGICRMREYRWRSIGKERYEAELYRLGLWEPLNAWNLDYQFERGYDTDGQGNVAAACAKWLEDRLGPEEFWRLYVELSPSNYRELLKQRFSASWEALQADFLAFREALEPPPDRLR